MSLSLLVAFYDMLKEIASGISYGPVRHKNDVSVLIVINHFTLFPVLGLLAVGKLISV